MQRVTCLDCGSIMEEGTECCNGETETVCDCDTCRESENPCSESCSCSDMGLEVMEFCQRCYEQFADNLHDYQDMDR